MQGMKISEQNNTLEIIIIKGKERETSTYIPTCTGEHYLQNGELSPYVLKIMYRDGAFVAMFI